MSVEAETAVVLDRDELDRNSMGDRALQKELFDLYFDHAPKNFASLRAALDGSGPAGGWKEGAHALKGAARTLGMAALGEVAAAAERSSPSADRLAAIEAAFAAARAAVDAYLAEA